MLAYLLRHAKAERDSPTGRDEDRPLAALGFEQARYLGDMLARAHAPLEHKPDRILTSPAERASRTALIIASALGLDPQTEPLLSLDSNERDVERVLKRIAAQHDPVMLVGHNPTLEDVIIQLTIGQPGAPEKLRTGELIALDVTSNDRELQARYLASFRLDDDA